MLCGMLGGMLGRMLGGMLCGMLGRHPMNDIFQGSTAVIKLYANGAKQYSCIDCDIGCILQIKQNPTGLPATIFFFLLIN